eukprot:TRINITY_DN2881_c0_g1_i1.p1 TRINITY_DN2881_c0_g1~~TRINITY_DN2881_c0_g1_i1.p1  ORF type:complete len:330 (-),score=82.02 TRINITY_DN2881_c0_g1_i1:21-881(-)
MGALDKKLKYQIDKLIKAATQGTVTLDEKLLHKPDLESFANVEEEAVYRAPKSVEVFFPGSLEKQKDIQKKKLEKARRSKMANFLEEEYGDKPAEIDTSGAGLDPLDRDLREEQEIDEYEREYFMPAPKKKAKEKKKQIVIDPFRDLEDYRDVSVIAKVEEHQKQVESAEQRSLEEILSGMDSRKENNEVVGNDNSDNDTQEDLSDVEDDTVPGMEFSNEGSREKMGVNLGRKRKRNQDDSDHTFSRGRGGRGRGGSRGRGRRGRGGGSRGGNRGRGRGRGRRGRE